MHYDSPFTHALNALAAYAAGNGDALPTMAVDGTLLTPHSQIMMSLSPNGKLTCQTIGTTDIGAQGQKLDSHTLFNIASITKTFTAVAAVQLAHQGYFENGLDTPLRENLERWTTALKEKYPNADFENFERLIREKSKPGATLRDLLAHSSGIAEAHRGNKSGPFGWIGFNTDAPIADAPSYSNPAYSIAGYILQAATGKNLDEIVREQVIQRHGLSATFFQCEYAQLQDKPSLTQPYWSDGKGFFPVEAKADFIAEAPGGLISNGRDLLRLMHIIVEDKEGLYADMHPKPGQKWGMGLDSIELAGQRWFGHSGGGGGFGAYAFINPETLSGFIETRVGLQGLDMFSHSNQVAYLDSLQDPVSERLHHALTERVSEALQQQRISLKIADATPEVLATINMAAIEEAIESAIKEVQLPSLPKDWKPKTSPEDIVKI